MAPKISIIVATYNAERTLHECIQSIRRQTFNDYEMIIVDGGSSDDTVKIIESNSDIVSKWISERDNGIYDAWNKGIAMASGEWVSFVGADDAYANEGSLGEIVSVVAEHDLAFGRIKYIDRGGACTKVVGEPWNWKRMLRYQNIAHPGALHKRVLFEKYGTFNQSYRIAGDYDFLLRVGEQANAAFTNNIIMICGDEGVSRTQVRDALLETRQIQVQHSEVGGVRANYNYLIARAKAFARSLI